MLETLFDLQAELNKRIGYDTKALREDFDPTIAGRMWSLRGRGVGG